jgi:hypothetical protein
MYVVQVSMVANLDFAFVSELATRLALVWSSQLEPFFIDIDMLFKQEPLDWYLIGYRWGILWKMMFDLKISS